MPAVFLFRVVSDSSGALSVEVRVVDASTFLSFGCCIHVAGYALKHWEVFTTMRHSTKARPLPEETISLGTYFPAEWSSVARNVYLSDEFHATMSVDVLFAYIYVKTSAGVCSSGCLWVLLLSFADLLVQSLGLEVIIALSCRCAHIGSHRVPLIHFFCLLSIVGPGGTGRHGRHCPSGFSLRRLFLMASGVDWGARWASIMSISWGGLWAIG